MHHPVPQFKSLITSSLFVLKTLNAISAANDTCVDISPGTILGYSEGCDPATGDGCDTASFDSSYDTEYSHVLCRLTHMCIMLEENELVTTWGLTHDRLLELTLSEPTCKPHHVTSAIQNEGGDHLMFCSRKACKEDLSPAEIAAHLLETGDLAMKPHEHFNCGTETIVNDTHVVYHNHIVAPEKSLDGKIVLSDNKQLKIPFICSFERDFFRTTRLDWSRDAVIKKIVLLSSRGEGLGEFSVALRLYKDYNFEEFHVERPVINPNDQLYLGVDVLHTGFEETTLYPMVHYVWTTQTPDATPNEYSRMLIFQGCGNVDNVTIVANGGDDVAKFATPPVIHINDACSEFTDCRVYVHAFVKLCSPFENGACSFNCTKSSFTLNWRDTIKQELGSRTLGKVRSKRDADKKVYSGNVLSLGPLFVERKRTNLQNGENDEKVYITRVITNGGLGTTAVVLLCVACLTVGVLLVVFVVVFRKKYSA